MQTKKYIPILLAATFLGSSLLVGCDQDTPVPIESTISTETIPEETMESTLEETIIETLPEETTTEILSEDENLKSITITVFNSSDVNVGMFSVIDPVTNEQINVDSLESGTIVSLECNWPIDTAEFQWALYNEAGDLCIDASTDISNVTTAVALNLSGVGTIDNVEVISE